MPAFLCQYWGAQTQVRALAEQVLLFTEPSAHSMEQVYRFALSESQLGCARLCIAD